MCETLNLAQNRIAGFSEVLGVLRKRERSETRETVCERPIQREVPLFEVDNYDECPFAFVSSFRDNQTHRPMTSPGLIGLRRERAFVG